MLLLGESSHLSVRDNAVSINARASGITDIASKELPVLGSTTEAHVDLIDRCSVCWVGTGILLRSKLFFLYHPLALFSLGCL